MACGRTIPIQLSLPGIGQSSLRNRESIFVADPVAQPGKLNTLRLEKQPGLSVTLIRIAAVY